MWLNRAAGNSKTLWPRSEEVGGRKYRKPYNNRIFFACNVFLGARITLNEACNVTLNFFFSPGSFAIAEANIFKFWEQSMARHEIRNTGQSMLVIYGG